MPDIVNGDLLRLGILTRLGSQQGVNVLYYRVTAASTPSLSLQKVANALSTAYSTVYKPLLANVARFDGVSISMPEITPLPTTLYSVSGSGVGTGGTIPLPGQVTGLLSLYSAVAGRANRGRKYIPFPAVEANEFTTQAVPTDGYVGLLNTLGELMALPIDLVDPDDALKTATLQPIIYHGPPPGIDRDVAYYYSRKKWATQRGRGAYGANEF